METIKIRLLILIFSLLFMLKLLDWGLFQYIYFLFPNELEWDTSPWYNFLHYRAKIPTSENDARILIVGSSVALYSVLPQEMRIQNQETNINDIYLYSHVAMAPTDAYYYLDDILSKKPKMIVYILNPADLQMEYIYEQNGKLFYDTKEWLSHFFWRHPARIIYPWKFSRDYFFDLPKSSIYKLWAKSFLYVNRYREFFWDPFFAYVERHFRKAKSYHIYTGSIPLEGIWQDGWTKPKTSLVCEFSQKKRNEVIFIPLPESILKIVYENGRMEEWKFQKRGWQNITLESDSDKSLITMEIDKIYSSRLAENKNYGKEYWYGFRLSQNFCKNKLEQNFSYVRPNFLEEKRFSEMSIQEYIEDYEERIYKDAEIRPELSRFRTLSNAKSLLNKHEFTSWIEIERIGQIQDILEPLQIPFLVILSPENPLELKKYKNGNWYRGFLDHLGERLKGHFYDYSELFDDPRYFSDPHHLTYEGALKFTKILESIVSQELIYEH